MEAMKHIINVSDEDGGHPVFPLDHHKETVQPASLEQQLHNEVVHNWTQQHHESQFDMLRHPAWRGVIMAVYISVILIGIVGNSIVVYVVARNKNMQNVTNIFIANLALSDIGLCVFSLPIQLYYQLTDTWIFGEVMCRAIFAAFAVPMHVSALTILLIAFDRYWLIVYPLRNRMSVRTAFILIVCSVIVSILLSVPVMLFAQVEDIQMPDIGYYRLYCLEGWPKSSGGSDGRLIYSLLMFIFQFCLPLSMTALLYYRIYCRLRRRPSQRVTIHERKQKTNKILVAIVTLFIFCWLPWNLFSLVTEVKRDAVEGRHFKFIDLLLKVFAMGSACINPFLYCWLNENFRKELDSMAIKLHIYKQSSLRRQNMPTYQVDAPEENGLMTTNDIYPTMATERTSMAHGSAFSAIPSNGEFIAANIVGNNLSITHIMHDGMSLKSSDV